ncbi:MAG: YraN family protein, partial [Spirochaetales bacterium]|nr:YraN family protein [Spirochaetales bacterium]
MRSNTKKGRSGEDLAAEFLAKQGVEIIERNYHTKFGEIDLIGFDKSTIIFIEVKLRNNDNFGTPV